MRKAEMKHESEMQARQLEVDRIRNETLDVSTRANTSRDMRAGIKIPKLPVFRESEDGIDSYLQRYERYAQNAGWSEDEYALGLSSLLTGRALDVFSRMPAEDMNDYGKLKEALLFKFSLTSEDYRKQFFQGRQSTAETASQYLSIIVLVNG